MGLPKWEFPDVSQVKKKMGPNWDQHGNAQVGVPKCVPCGPLRQNVVGPTLAPHMGPMWAIPLSN